MARPIAGGLFHKSKTLNDKYLLGDEIGKGAYGRVYKGVDLQNGDFVAIKQVSLENILTEDLHSIMLEIDLLKNLNHKNIVKYRGSFKTKSHLYIILEYVENGALASIIKPNKFGAFPESLTAVYIAQVLEGLVYLHEQGVIHRDIKGANILTTKEGLVKLADFGVATKLNEADADTRSVVGTPYWMAPEVIEMSGVTASSDIWSVGCTVIELMTCSPPYYDLQPMPALFRIVQDDRPPFPDGLSALLVDFLTLCFQKDPKLRPDAKQLLKHQWIRNSRRQMQSSWKDSAGKISSISQDVAAVVVRSIEQDGHEVTSAPPLDLENDPLVRDPFESESEDERPPHSPSMSSPSGSAAAVEKNKPIRISRQSLDRGLLTSGDLGRPPKPSEIVGSVFDSPRPLTPGESIPGGEIEMDGWGDQGGRSARGLAQHPDDRPSTSGLQVTSPRRRGQPRAANRKEEREIAAVIEGRRLSQEGDLEAEDEGATQVDEIEGLGGKLEGRENYPKQVAEMTKLLGVLKPDRKEDAILQAADRLCILFREYPEQKTQLIGQYGVTPVMEMLEVSSTQAVYAVLYVLNQLIEGNSEYLEQLCLVGAVPLVLRFSVPEAPRLIRMQAVLFVREVTHAGGMTLQMLVACGGLPVLVAFLEGDYNDNKEIVFMAIDGICKVFELKSPTPKNDFCRLFAKCGALDRLVSALSSTNDEAQRVKTSVGLSPRERASVHARNLSGDSAGPFHRLDGFELSRSGLGRLEGADLRGGGFPSPNGSTASRAPLLGAGHSATSSASSMPGGGHHRSTSSFGKGGRGSGGSAQVEKPYGVTPNPAEAWAAAETARGYVAKLANLLLVFSHADSLVKGFMCSLQLLHRLFKMMERLEQPILVKMLRCIKNLSEDANTLEPLQRAGAIPCLVPILARKEGPFLADMQNQVLSALYNLCKINKTRQEQAAVAGIIPPLLALIRNGSPLKQYALPLVCDMAHASRRTRAELWKNKGLEFYLDLLKDEEWQVAALDSIAMWLAHDHEQRKVEPALLEKANVQKLVDFFGVASGPTFRNILEPFLKIVTKSPKLNTALALSGLTALLVSRLEHGDAVAKLTLLKIIKAVYEHHPRPKQFTVEHDLPRKLQRLVEGDRDGEMVLVKQMASSLLKALHINSVL